VLGVDRKTLDRMIKRHKIEFQKRNNHRSPQPSQTAWELAKAFTPAVGRKTGTGWFRPSQTPQKRIDQSAAHFEFG